MAATVSSSNNGPSLSFFFGSANAHLAPYGGQDPGFVGSQERERHWATGCPLQFDKDDAIAKWAFLSLIIRSTG